MTELLTNMLPLGVLIYWSGVKPSLCRDPSCKTREVYLRLWAIMMLGYRKLKSNVAMGTS